jgi:hypothetical protein
MHHLLAADVDAKPNAEGMPGADLAQTLINWLAQVALWGSLASILLGAALYGLSKYSSNYNGADKGRQLAIAGLVGSCLVGVAPAAVNLFSKAAGA